MNLKFSDDYINFFIRNSAKVNNDISYAINKNTIFFPLTRLRMKSRVKIETDKEKSPHSPIVNLSASQLVSIWKLLATGWRKGIKNGGRRTCAQYERTLLTIDPATAKRLAVKVIGSRSPDTLLFSSRRGYTMTTLSRQNSLLFARLGFIVTTKYS